MDRVAGDNCPVCPALSRRLKRAVSRDASTACLLNTACRWTYHLKRNVRDVKCRVYAPKGWVGSRACEKGGHCGRHDDRKPKAHEQQALAAGDAAGPAGAARAGRTAARRKLCVHGQPRLPAPEPRGRAVYL